MKAWTTTDRDALRRSGDGSVAGFGLVAMSYSFECQTFRPDGEPTSVGAWPVYTGHAGVSTPESSVFEGETLQVLVRLHGDSPVLDPLLDGQDGQGRGTQLILVMVDGAELEGCRRDDPEPREGEHLGQVGPEGDVVEQHGSEPGSARLVVGDDDREDGESLVETPVGDVSQDVGQDAGPAEVHDLGYPAVGLLLAVGRRADQDLVRLESAVGLLEAFDFVKRLHCLLHLVAGSWDRVTTIPDSINLSRREDNVKKRPRHGLPGPRSACVIGGMVTPIG